MNEVVIDGQANIVLKVSEGGGGGGSCQNWVDGQATGSVRLVSAHSEDENYSLGESAVAEGHGTKASGQASHAEGWQTEASGNFSHTEGEGTSATAPSAHSEGDGSVASGWQSHAEGYNTTASNRSAHSEGNGTLASGEISHAEGYMTEASGDYSHAEGIETKATGEAQHVFGKYNIADTGYLEIVGNGRKVRNPITGQTSTVRSNARTLDQFGNETLAGKLTVGADPVEDMDVATKQYVDDHAGGGAGGILLIEVNGIELTASYNDVVEALESGKVPVLKEVGSSGSTWLRYVCMTGTNSGYSGYPYFVSFIGGNESMGVTFASWYAADPDAPLEALLM